MSDMVELKFCDLCGVSIPQRDLDEGTAREVANHIVGVCCLSKILAGIPDAHRPKAPAPAIGSSGVPGLYAAIVLLLTLFFVTYYIDSRAHQRAKDLNLSIGATDKRLAELEGYVKEQGTTLSEFSFEALETSVGGIDRRFDALDSRLAKLGSSDDSAGLTAIATTLTEIRRELGKLGGDQSSFEASLDSRFRQVTSAIGDLERGLKDMSGPREVPAKPGETTPAEPPERKTPTLSEALAKRVKQLASTDASVRWAAVDELLRSGDQYVVPHLLPMLEDPDAFVRRLCATGLGNLGAESACGALVTALEDEQPIVRQAAYRSLVKLSGQNFVFDAQASKAKRRVQVKKWKDWLKKAD